MELLKRMEAALILEWKTLQLELDPIIRAIAVEAYYVNYRAYRRQRTYYLRLNSLIG